MEEVVRTQLPLKESAARLGVPEEFLLQHITQSYISMVEWWLKSHPELTPQELDEYFRAVIHPLLEEK